MITDARDLAQRLSNWAIEATEIGFAHRCGLQLRIDPDGLLIAATSHDGRRSKAAVVLWDEVLAFGTTVSRSMTELAEQVTAT